MQIHWIYLGFEDSFDWITIICNKTIGKSVMSSIFVLPIRGEGET